MENQERISIRSWFIPAFWINLLSHFQLFEMIFSQHNIFSKIKESENFFIVNLLSGNADILSPEEAEKINGVRNNEVIDDKDFVSDLVEKGYLVDRNEENKLYLKRYLDFIDKRDNDEVQLFFCSQLQL